MGSSGDTSVKSIEPVVGGLVWVRRRNGSWWPGRILGADEVPESSLVSPKLGTPVKLLGREDASVDWYNLDKSRRVKAFRCGEYDECIRKAKVAAANANRKKVKYARREDAIIHALELESVLESKDHPELSLRIDEPIGEEGDGGEGEPSADVKESPTTSDEETELMPEDLNSFEDNSNSALELSHSGVSFEEPNQISASKEQSVEGRRRRTPNDSEDDGTEGIKRMRGLEDLGMGVASSLKRKRSQAANVHEFLKRKNRRRQLAKVLESTAMVTVPVMCEGLPSPTRSPLRGVSDSKVSGLESDESKRSFSMVVNNNSDSTGISCENGTSLNPSEHACDAPLTNCKQKENEISSMLGLPENDSSVRLFDVPFVREDKHHSGFHSILVSCATQKPQVGAGAQSSQSSLVETAFIGNEELNESGSTSSGAADINNISHNIEKDTSKWQLKGKRNSRQNSRNRKQYSKKYADVVDESNAYLTVMQPEDAFSLGSDRKVNRNPSGLSHSSDRFTYRAKSRPVAETLVDEFQGWSRHSSKKETHSRHPATEMLTQQRFLPYRQSRFTVNPKYQMSDLSLRNYGAGSCLYDVNLEVKASYRPQHVPYISLMSKLNGQPITGHPVAVEVLDDGFCDILISGSECYSSSCDLDHKLGGNLSALRGVDKVYVVKPSSRSARTPTKHVVSQARRSPSKSAKSKKNGLLSKKIRKLSSLTGSHKLRAEDKKLVVEKLKGPSVACVPLKVVFSRINAALGSSMRPVHRVAMPSNL